MQIGLLGELEVTRDGVRVPIGRGKRRSLLALLVLHATRWCLPSA